MSENIRYLLYIVSFSYLINTLGAFLPFFPMVIHDSLSTLIIIVAFIINFLRIRDPEPKLIFGPLVIFLVGIMGLTIAEIYHTDLPKDTIIFNNIAFLSVICIAFFVPQIVNLIGESAGGRGELSCDLCHTSTKQLYRCKKCGVHYCNNCRGEPAICKNCFEKKIYVQPEDLDW